MLKLMSIFELEKAKRLEQDRVRELEYMLKNQAYNNIYKNELDIKKAIKFEQNELKLVEQEIERRTKSVEQLEADCKKLEELIEVLEEQFENMDGKIKTNESKKLLFNSIKLHDKLLEEKRQFMNYILYPQKA